MDSRETPYPFGKKKTAVRKMIRAAVDFTDNG